jgi:hypothetical protein
MLSGHISTLECCRLPFFQGVVIGLLRRPAVSANMVDSNDG